MNEQLAKQILLVRAIDTNDPGHVILSEDDLRRAGNEARDYITVGNPGITLGAQSDIADFIGARARFLSDRVLKRFPSLELIDNQSRYLAAAATVVPMIALVVGIAADRITDPHKVDLLSAPLLGILAWNVVVYIGMLGWKLSPRKPHHNAATRWLRARGDYLAGGTPPGLQAAMLAFFIEWRHASRTLDAARIGRMLHLSAALFAAGAALSLYLRGLLTQYATGWESTFLNPTQVHAILSIVSAPAQVVFQIQPFSLSEIGALRDISGATPAAAGSGARWVHLYAATLLLVAILPRLLLAGIDHWRVRHLRHDFPLSLAHPYFRRIASDAGGETVFMRVRPYSYGLDAPRLQAVSDIGGVLLGGQAQVIVEESTRYGAEAALSGHQLPGAAEAAMLAVLFNMAATPEIQNHGAFLEQAKQDVLETNSRLLVLLDESGYRARLGSTAGSEARLSERRALWLDFVDQHRLQATLVDLLDPTRHPGELRTVLRSGSGP